MKRYSFASKLKEIATDLFGMTTKDRKLLQILGTKMKEIDDKVWIKYLLKSIDNENNVVIEDVRYINEYDALKTNGFVFIYLDIDKKLQKERLMSLYQNDYDQHIRQSKHSSETESERLRDRADYIIKITKDKVPTVEDITNVLLN